MSKSFPCTEEKESLVAEYLLGILTYRQHNDDFRIIHFWVMKFKG